MADTPNPLQMTPAEAAGGAAGIKSYYSRNPGSAPGSVVAPVSTNPGASVKYDPSNPFNVGVAGTGNFTNSSMPGGTPAAPVPQATPVPDVSTIPSPANLYPTQTPEAAATSARNFGMANVQDQINSLSAMYDKQLADELAAAKPGEENAMGRTNALSAMMGLAGSSSADTRTATTEKSNADINSAITSKVTAQKIAALNAIYGSVDKFSQDAYLKQIATNQTNQKAQLDAQVQQGNQLIGSFANQYSGLGKTFEDFKNLDGGQTLTKLENMTGKSEYQLRQDWNNSLPANLQPHVVDASYQNPDGTTHYKEIQVDPVTGKQSIVSEQDVAMPFASYNSGKNLLSGPNGEKYAPSMDANGNIVYKPIGIGKPQTINAGKYGSYQYDPVTDSWKQISVPASTNPASAGKELTSAEYAKLNGVGIDKNLADSIVGAIIKGESLDEIRNDMRNIQIDPKVLDQFDTAVGIARIQKFAKPSSSSGFK